MCLGEGHIGWDAASWEPNLKPRVCPSSGLHWGVKGPTGASAILAAASGPGHADSPVVASLLSACPTWEDNCPRAAHAHPRSVRSRTGRGKLRVGGGGERRPSNRDRELAIGDVPLTRLVFALSAAFEPAASSAAVGVGGMENAVCHHGEKQQCRSATTITT